MVSCAKQLDIITAYFVTQGKRRILALKILDARQEVEAEAVTVVGQGAAQKRPYDRPCPETQTNYSKCKRLVSQNEIVAGSNYNAFL